MSSVPAPTSPSAAPAWPRLNLLLARTGRIGPRWLRSLLQRLVVRLAIGWLAFAVGLALLRVGAEHLLRLPRR